MKYYEFIVTILIFVSTVLFSCLVKCDCPVNRCEWLPWNQWSDCSRQCAGGIRHRDRSLCCKADLAHDSKLCWENCGWNYNDDSWTRYHDNEDCNTFCYNGGTYVFSGYCRCPDRYKGTCCREEVTCGRPSSISHGRFSGSDFTYAGRVRYTCDRNYGMTDPSKAVRTCTASGYWSGSAPTCLYAAHCNSSPCKNRARCKNLVGDYRCYCKTGWTGKNCEIDIQPPVVSGCPSDRNLVVYNMTTNQSWTEPTITDPHGTSVHITKNYKTSSFEFPWGEYTIHYHGVKHSNGLSAECKFKISVKPSPCKKMSPPVNGIIMCNGWSREYSQICMFECKANYTFPPGFKRRDIYVCGATGRWLPADSRLQCVSEDLFPDSEAGKISTCTSTSDKQALANGYIDRLKASPFRVFCEKYLGECNNKNVIVTC